MVQNILVKRLILVFIFLLALVTGRSQLVPGELSRFINNASQFGNLKIPYKTGVKTFYDELQYKPVWSSNSDITKQMLDLLRNASEVGLEAADYEYALTPGLGGVSTPEGELLLTGAAIQFTHDLLYGNKPGAIGYNGLDYEPACRDPARLLTEAIESGQLSNLPGIASLKTPEYDSLAARISQYRRIVSGSDFTEVKIRSDKVAVTNRPLVIKLFQLGLLDSITQELTDDDLKEKVKSAQRLFGLLADGVLRSTALEALNVPVLARLREMNNAVNTLRWLRCIRQSGKVIVVNIPSATLHVFENDSIILESRIIVGKRSTPTPTLCSRVTEVILYPYWMAPHSIATRELLPSIKRNIGFLDANGYQVINQQGRVVDPTTINWQELSVSNFPYKIRQSTGCDNALGLVKLNFYNPYSVYLHDTPGKELFGLNKRFFSHGCMRVEKAMELAKLVLRENAIAVDTLEEKGCLYHQSPLVVPVGLPIPVFVLYNTAWFDSTGTVIFSEDIYRKNRNTGK